MNLKVGQRNIEFYNSFNIILRFDSVASTFSGNILFDPYNPNDRSLFIPGSYNLSRVQHDGQTLITGVLLSQKHKSSAQTHLMSVGGYSKSGVIEDCQNPATNQVQYNGRSLLSIAEQLLSPFGLKVSADKVVQADINTIFPSQVIETDQTIKEYLSKAAAQKNIVLSHDAEGNLVFTRADTNKEPIANFTNVGNPWLDMELTFDGQGMHSLITAQGQQGVTSTNGSQAEMKNPYVQLHLDWLGTAGLNTLGQAGVKYNTGYRPRVSMQTSGGDNQTQLTARQLLSQELKGIRLEITIAGWELNGKLVRPNNIITVMNPDVFLYQKTKWFIETVDLNSDEKGETAKLTCVLPECYNNDEVKNVFLGTNITVALPKEEPIVFYKPVE